MTTCSLSAENTSLLKLVVRDALVDTLVTLRNGFLSVTDDAGGDGPVVPPVTELFEDTIQCYAEEFVQHVKSGRYTVTGVSWRDEVDSPLAFVDLVVSLDRGAPDRLNERWAFEWDEELEPSATYKFKYRSDVLKDLVAATTRR